MGVNSTKEGKNRAENSLAFIFTSMIRNMKRVLIQLKSFIRCVTIESDTYQTFFSASF